MRDMTRVVTDEAYLQHVAGPMHPESPGRLRAIWNVLDATPISGVQRGGAREATREELLRFFDGKVAKFWMPDDVLFVDALPLGATGKIQKNRLREQFRDYRLPATEPR